MFLSPLLRKKLTDFILLNGYSCNASGLYYGKAGIALALFELARFYKSDYLEHHAFEILQESLLTKTQNIDFVNGLSGIGYSLQYLIRQNYIDTNYNELFGDQHRKIIQTISRQNFIFSNFQEIFGIYLYIESTKEYLPTRKFQELRQKVFLFIKEYFEKISSQNINITAANEFYENVFLIFHLQSCIPLNTLLDKVIIDRVKVCLQQFLEKDYVCEHAGLGPLAIYMGLKTEDREILQTGEYITRYTLKNTWSELLSLRQKTMIICNLSQLIENPSYSSYQSILKKITNTLSANDLHQGEIKICNSIYHKNLFSSLSEGVPRLLLTDIYANRTDYTHLRWLLNN